MARARDHIYRTLKLSTDHIPEGVDLKEARDLPFEELEHGWLLWVQAPDTDTLDWLWPILRWCTEGGVEWVIFDQDAGTVEDFKTWSR